MDQVVIQLEPPKTHQEPPRHSHEGGGTCINIHVLEERLKALQERLKALQERLHAVETAFPRTSVGTPAFDKHRDYHEEEDLKETRVKQIQNEITKKIIVVVFGALLSTLLSGFSDDILKFFNQMPLYSRELSLKQNKTTNELSVEGGDN